jgi:alpha-D-ribose 1-methylphosphonate 5-triphosphate diphosphatase
MSTELTLKNAKIVTPTGSFHGWVRLRDGSIDDMQMGYTDVAGAIDLEGDYLIPGLVDLHTDNFERLMRPRSGVDWPVIPALVAHDAHMVSAGITTVFDSLCVGFMGSGSRNFDTLKKTIGELEKCRQSGIFRGDHLLHLRAEVSVEIAAEQFASVFPRESVRMVSLMDHTPGQRQWRDLDKYAAMLKKDFHWPQENVDKFLKTAQENHETFSGPNRVKLLSMVEGHSLALASHDDTTVEHVEQAHAQGIAISEFPTTVEAAEAARAKGMRIVAGSPNVVLGGSHSGNVAAEELARRGLLDALASDYVPSSMLHGAFLLHEKVGMPLHEAIATVSLAPARMVGLDDRGSIEIGKRADLVRVKMAHGLPIPVSVWREGMRVN